MDTLERGATRRLRADLSEGGGLRQLSRCLNRRAARSSFAFVRVSPRREGSAGAALCNDASAFQLWNRCPLWPGRLNRWTVRRTLQGKPSDAEILRGVGDVLAAWFAPEHAWTSAPLLVNVRALARRKSLEVGGEVAAASDFVEPVPCMLADSFATLAVDFVYFGAALDMPWPVRDASGAWLPIDCVWALDLVGGLA